MKTSIKAIHVASILFGIFGLLVAFESRKLSRWSPEYGPGPGFLPFGLGLLIFVFAVLTLIGEVRKKDKVEAGAPFYRGWSQDRKPLLTIVALAFLVFSVNLLGFYVASSLFIVFLTKVIERKPWWMVFSVTAVAMLGFYLIFSLFLDIQLPSGYFGR